MTVGLQFIALLISNRTGLSSRLGTSCKLVFPRYRHSNQLTLEWSDVRRHCQKLGWDLAKIALASENQFISDLVTKQKKITDAGVWLGLHRKADNKFYWADDTLLAGYSNWNTGEPNSVAEKCCHMYTKGSVKGKWNDWTCSRTSDSSAKNAAVVLCQKKARH